MDLSHGHFYKTIEEAETAIQQFSKEHYFIRLKRSGRITKILFVGNRPRRIKKNLFVGNRSRRIKIMLFVVNRPPTNKHTFIRWDSRRITTTKINWQAYRIGDGNEARRRINESRMDSVNIFTVRYRTSSFYDMFCALTYQIQRTKSSPKAGNTKSSLPNSQRRLNTTIPGIVDSHRQATQVASTCYR